MHKVVIGNAELYHADCLDVLPNLPQACLVIADPPYGIGESNAKAASRGKLAAPIDYGSFDWDKQPASPEQIAATIAAGKHCIIWGGNYFDLPPQPGWLTWDKMNGGNDFADCELAWSNLPIAARLFRHMWNGMLRDSERNEPRVHPTQKPIALMKWCITKRKEMPKLIVDPFAGSGPVGVACMDMGIKYIGIEKMKRNFDILCERIDRAQQQFKLAL
jgi:site-specific DNA-methyltransferase (adenine-specific)/modification methylase